jgi:hypothetical protein
MRTYIGSALKFFVKNKFPSKVSDTNGKTIRHKRSQHEVRISKNQNRNKTTGTLKLSCCQALVAHACMLSYSGGRDHEDNNLKPAWAK